MNLITRCAGTERFRLASQAQRSAQDAETAIAQWGCGHRHENGAGAEQTCPPACRSGIKARRADVQEVVQHTSIWQSVIPWE